MGISTRIETCRALFRPRWVARQGGDILHNPIRSFPVLASITIGVVVGDVCSVAEHDLIAWVVPARGCRYLRDVGVVDGVLVVNRPSPVSPGVLAGAGEKIIRHVAAVIWAQRIKVRSESANDLGSLAGREAMWDDGDRRGGGRTGDREKQQNCCPVTFHRGFLSHLSCPLTSASHLAMPGVPMRAVLELVGHGPLEITVHNADLSPEVGPEAVNSLCRQFLPPGVPTPAEAVQAGTPATQGDRKVRGRQPASQKSKGKHQKWHNLPVGLLVVTTRVSYFLLLTFDFCLLTCAFVLALPSATNATVISVLRRLRQPQIGRVPWTLRLPCVGTERRLMLPER